MILASDSRGTFGDPRGVTAQNDNMKKVYSVSPHVGVLFSGSGELAATLIQEIRQQLNDNENSIDGITPLMNFVRLIFIGKYNEWFPGFDVRPIQGSQRPVRPALGVTIGGFELDEAGQCTEQKIYSLNSLNNFAPNLHDYGFSLNGVAQYALYLLNRLYDDGMNVNNLDRLGAYVITETASQDGKVGGPVQIMKITSDEGCVDYTQEEINRIMEENQTRSQGLQRLFEGG